MFSFELNKCFAVSSLYANRLLSNCTFFRIHISSLSLKNKYYNISLNFFLSPVIQYVACATSTNNAKILRVVDSVQVIKSFFKGLLNTEEKKSKPN